MAACRPLRPPMIEMLSMSDPQATSTARSEAIAGIIVGLALAAAVWIGTGAPASWLSSHLSAGQESVARLALPGAAALLPTPTATPLPPTDCIAPASTIASLGFDPYAILVRKRPDVLYYYGHNGWNPESQCVAIYDSWTKQGAGGTQPTTPAAYVQAHGWAPAAPVPTPAPPADCTAPASEVARLGFDPYRILALHRPDVLNLYQLNGWQPDTQCVQLFDNWLQHPDGGPATTAAAFVVEKGWAKGQAPAGATTPRATATPTAASALVTGTTPAATATSVLASATATPGSQKDTATTGTASTVAPPESARRSVTPETAAVSSTPQPAPDGGATPAPAVPRDTRYTVQPGDTLAGIAQREQVSLGALEQANSISNPNAIQSGQVLTIPAATTSP